MGANDRIVQHKMSLKIATPDFSSSGETECVRGPPVRGARRGTHRGVRNSTASKHNENNGGPIVYFAPQAMNIGVKMHKGHGQATRDHGPMCRNIKTLFNLDPPATDEELRAASLQFIRKLSGFTTPSRANQPAFDQSVDDASRIARDLIDSLKTIGASRNREIEAAKARAGAAKRFQ